MPRKPAQELGVSGTSESTTHKKQCTYVTAVEAVEGPKTKWPREEGFGENLRKLFTIFNVYKMMVFPCSKITQDTTFANTTLCFMWFAQHDQQKTAEISSKLTAGFEGLFSELDLTSPPVRLNYTDQVRQTIKTVRDDLSAEAKSSMEMTRKHLPDTTLLQETYTFYESVCKSLVYMNPGGIPPGYVYTDVTSALQPALKKHCPEARYVRAMTFTPTAGMFGPVFTPTVVPEQPFAAYSNIVEDIQALNTAERNAIKFEVSPDDLQSIKRGLEIMMRTEIDQEARDKIQATITDMGPRFFARVLELAQMVHKQVQSLTAAVCTLTNVADRNQNPYDELNYQAAGAVRDQQRLLLMVNHQISQLAEKAAEVEQNTRQLTAYSARSKTSVEAVFKLLAHEANKKKLYGTTVAQPVMEMNKEEFLRVLMTLGDLATNLIQSWITKEPERKIELSELEACVAVWQRMSRNESMAAGSTSPTFPPPPA